jgi:hypothetical protein
MGRFGAFGEWQEVHGVRRASVSSAALWERCRGKGLLAGGVGGEGKGSRKKDERRIWDWWFNIHR